MKWVGGIWDIMATKKELFETQQKAEMKISISKTRTSASTAPPGPTDGDGAENTASVPVSLQAVPCGLNCARQVSALDTLDFQESKVRKIAKKKSQLINPTT